MLICPMQLIDFAAAVGDSCTGIGDVSDTYDTVVPCARPRRPVPSSPWACPWRCGANRDPMCKQRWDTTVISRQHLPPSQLLGTVCCRGGSISCCCTACAMWPRRQVLWSSGSLPGNSLALPSPAQPCPAMLLVCCCQRAVRRASRPQLHTSFSLILSSHDCSRRRCTRGLHLGLLPPMRGWAAWASTHCLHSAGRKYCGVVTACHLHQTLATAHHCTPSIVPSSGQQRQR